MTQQIQSRFLSLREWAAAEFNTPPHKNTLLKWIHDGRIQPPPVKVGKKWQIKRGAQYRGD